MHHKASGKGSRDGEESEISFEWTLRKQAALVMDKLSMDFAPDEVLAASLPTIHSRLQHTDVWVRESALLALGALANGCRPEMGRHLCELVPFLLALVTDAMPEVRSIACWVLSRYSSWMFEEDEDTGTFPGAVFIAPLFQSLAVTMLDTVPKVQSAACSALCVVIDEGRDAVTPYIGDVLASVSRAFAIYGIKNQLVLCDTVTIFLYVCHCLFYV